MLGGQFKDRIHFAGPARQVHSDDGLSARGKHFSNAVRGDVLAVSLAISNHRPSTDRHRTTRRGYERAAGGDDLIPRADAQRSQSTFQSDSSVGNRERVFATGKGGEFLLEQAAFLPGPVVDVAALQHSSSSLDLIRSEIRPRTEECCGGSGRGHGVVAIHRNRSPTSTSQQRANDIPGSNWRPDRLRGTRATVPVRRRNGRRGGSVGTCRTQREGAKSLL